ncbi:MAG: hypothetical protein IPL31_08030 [Saprospiraceae bacterium]|nr:hypothetical protein [Saprospiraceae bacterium]
MAPIIKYYSFKIGQQGTLRSTWKMDDIKIPAYDLKHAVTMYLWMDWFRRKHENPWMFKSDKMFTPSDNWVNYHIRQVVEYELKSRRYYAIVNYKRVRIFNNHEFTEHFR